MNDLTIEIIGWIGGIEVLLAYFLVSYKYIVPESRTYHYLNLTGAILLIINTIFNKAYPSTFVNVVWVGIALYSLMRKKERP